MSCFVVDCELVLMKVVTLFGVYGTMTPGNDTDAEGVKALIPALQSWSHLVSM